MEGGMKTYLDWIKPANYFHATLMDVVFTHTMKTSQILLQRLLTTSVLQTVFSIDFFPVIEFKTKYIFKKFGNVLYVFFGAI